MPGQQGERIAFELREQLVLATRGGEDDLCTHPHCRREGIVGGGVASVQRDGQVDGTRHGVGAILVAGCMTWVKHNDLLPTERVADTLNQALNTAAGLSPAQQTGESAARINEPLSLDYLPAWLTRWSATRMLPSAGTCSRPPVRSCS